MVLDAFRGYVEMASGLTEVNRQRAVAEAKALLAQRGAIEAALSEQAKGLADDVGRQVQSLADDILATSRANRQILTTLIRSEAERAVGSLGLATAEEISSLRRHVERLEQKLDGGSGPAKKTAKKAPARKAAAKKTAKKAAPKTPGPPPAAAHPQADGPRSASSAPTAAIKPASDETPRTQP